MAHADLDSLIDRCALDPQTDDLALRRLKKRRLVLRDQIAFMLRCGFDALDLDDRAAAGWDAATTAFSAWYQPATDGQAPVPARRRHAAPARTSAAVLRSAPVRPEPVRQPDPVELAVCAATWAY